MTDRDPAPDSRPAPPAASAPSPRSEIAEIRSEELLRGQRMVIINHHGQRYRLVETRNGKLILQK